MNYELPGRNQVDIWTCNFIKVIFSAQELLFSGIEPVLIKE
jgi:hypothetical protein